MKHSNSQSHLVSLVSEAVSAAIPDLGPLSSSSVLLGEGAILDSVGLITALIGIEERLQGAIDLAASFMAFGTVDAGVHPFRTIGSLAEHLSGQLQAAALGGPAQSSTQG
jgi:hypothetical protein